MNKKRIFEILSSDMAYIVLSVLNYFIFLALLLMIMESIKSDIVTFIFVGVCAIMGWFALEKITPSSFVIFSFAGMIIYVLVKGALSFILGLLLAPYYISKFICDCIKSYANGYLLGLSQNELIEQNTNSIE